MTTASAPADNPFVDPVGSFEDAGHGNSFAAAATLALGRNVSLTLGTDSLVVLGEPALPTLVWTLSNRCRQTKLSRREKRGTVAAFGQPVMPGKCPYIIL